MKWANILLTYLGILDTTHVGLQSVGEHSERSVRVPSTILLGLNERGHKSREQNTTRETVKQHLEIVLVAFYLFPISHWYCGFE